jgi:hypothetical protein
MASHSKRPEAQKRAAKKWVEENPEKRRAASAKWSKDNPEKVAAKQKVWRDKHPKKVLLSRAKGRAKKLERDFSITEDDFHLPDICPVLGIPMSLGGDIQSSPSLDRLDSNKGYVKGNVWVISWLANIRKSSQSFEDLEKLYLAWKDIRQKLEVHDMTDREKRNTFMVSNQRSIMQSVGLGGKVHTHMEGTFWDCMTYLTACKMANSAIRTELREKYATPEGWGPTITLRIVSAEEPSFIVKESQASILLGGPS